MAGNIANFIDGTELVQLETAGGIPIKATMAQLSEALGDGTVTYRTQTTPAAKVDDATLTIAELLAGLVTVTKATAVALTLPTGALSDAGVEARLDANRAFDWGVINLGSVSGAVTMTAGVGHTYVGNAVVAIGTSARFRTRKTAADTFVTYRLA